MAEPPRRFPTPWTVHQSEDAYWVEDAKGHRFGYCYFRKSAIVAGNPAMLERDEARRLAANIAKLPGLLNQKAH